jgi:hypothetical protein
VWVRSRATLPPLDARRVLVCCPPPPPLAWRGTLCVATLLTGRVTLSVSLSPSHRSSQRSTSRHSQARCREERTPPLTAPLAAVTLPHFTAPLEPPPRGSNRFARARTSRTLANRRRTRTRSRRHAHESPARPAAPSHTRTSRCGGGAGAAAEAPALRATRPPNTAPARRFALSSRLRSQKRHTRRSPAPESDNQINHLHPSRQPANATNAAAYAHHDHPLASYPPET